MGDSEWQEVTRKKHYSVFERLKFPQPKTTSRVNNLAKISLSVYVFNFPSHITVRELWNICSKMGTLVDVYIAKPRFHRKVVVKAPHADVKVGPPIVKSDHNVFYASKATSYANAAKSPVGGSNNTKADYEESGENNSSRNELKQMTTTDFPLGILGCYMDFHSIANTRSLCQCEGFLDVEFKHLGGLWVMFVFSSLDARNKFLKHEGILSWFTSLKPWHDDFVGEVIFSDDSDSCNRLSKRLCIKSYHAMLVFATIMVSLYDVTYAIRVRELCKGEGMAEENDAKSIVGSIDYIEEVKADLEHVFQKIKKDSSKDMGYDVTPLDSNPFGLDSLIKKKCGNVNEAKHSETLDFPLGFSPNKHSNQSDNSYEVWNLKRTSGSESIHKHLNERSQKQSGFSLLERLEETIKVGLPLGLNMEGCESTLFALIAENGDLKWDGILVVMGDFNKVRDAGERFGVVLEKGILDHRHILLKEFEVDYGSTSF
ncbi:reverse transcriptase domain, reverse transcriptase zinc-binding domain protein [Tanacetum coccineum]